MSLPLLRVLNVGLQKVNHPSRVMDLVPVTRYTKKEPPPPQG